jgi:hypothetical protein
VEKGAEKPKNTKFRLKTMAGTRVKVCSAARALLPHVKQLSFQKVFFLQSGSANRGVSTLCTPIKITGVAGPRTPSKVEFETCARDEKK